MSIDVELEHTVQLIRINREEALNAFDIGHLDALIEALQNAGNNTNVGAVVIIGQGRAFSVGGDIKAMDKMTDADFVHAAECYQTLCRIARGVDKPIVAAVNGYALGGGLEIALIADIRFAARSAVLGLPDAELGFSPTGGLTYLLNHVVGAGWAMHLAMTAEMLSAEKALEIGLVTRVIDDEQLEAEALTTAHQLAAYPPTGMKNIKRAFNAALESSLASTLSLEAEYDTACYRSKETRAVLRAFIESRESSKFKA